VDINSERRAYKRIQLLAYACNKTCTLVLERERLIAHVVDVSAGGARLRAQNPHGASRGLALTFSLNEVDDGGLLQLRTACVRWTSDLELGIEFDQNLGVGVSALQKLLS